MQQVSFVALQADPACKQKIISYLKAGGVLIFPTDTLYGFAVDGDSMNGVASVYRLKGRDGKKPLVLLLESARRLSNLGIFPEPPVTELLNRFWPGPLTGVFSFSGAHGLSAFSGSSLGVRVPAHPDLLAFLADYPGFLLTTSANVSGEEPLFDPQELMTEFSHEISWMIADGILPLSEPSTVADMRCRLPKVLRPGKAKW